MTRWEEHRRRILFRFFSLCTHHTVQYNVIMQIYYYETSCCCRQNTEILILEPTMHWPCCFCCKLTIIYYLYSDLVSLKNRSLSPLYLSTLQFATNQIRSKCTCLMHFYFNPLGTMIDIDQMLPTFRLEGYSEKNCTAATHNFVL